MMAIFSYQFVFHPVSGEIPAFGKSYEQLVGVFITSWAFVMVVPAWVNEKKDHVSINKTVWSSCVFGMVTYIAFAVQCALSYPNLRSDDILKTMSSEQNLLVTRIASYLFSVFIIAPGIPVYSISVRYNLFVGRLCNKHWAYFWGVIFPWVISFIFTGSSAFASLLNWSALLFTGIVNFIIPFCVYYIAYVNRATKLKTMKSQVQNVSTNNDGTSSSSGEETEVTESEESLLHSLDKVFPKFMKPFTRVWVIILLVSISLLTVLQIFVSLYYTFVLGINIVSN